MKALGKTYKPRDPAMIYRDAEMVLMFRRGKTLEQIGRKYGITRERVRQRFARIGLAADCGGHSVQILLGARTKIDAENQRAVAKDEKFFRRYGMPRREALALAPYKFYDRRHPFRKFMEQRRNAWRRGIDWKLSLAAWWRIWQESGHWEQRGRGAGYCMARWGDDGPYSVDNVYICTIGQNFKDGYITKPASARAEKRRRTLALVAQSNP